MIKKYTPKPIPRWGSFTGTVIALVMLFFAGSVNAQTTTIASGATVTIATGAVASTPGGITIVGTLTNNGTQSLMGDWNNGGTAAVGPGLILLNGTSQQNITSGTVTQFGDLTLNNPAGVLSNSVGSIVTGTLTLTNGIFTVSPPFGALSITNTSSSAMSGGSTTSFVDGPVQWSLASSGTYTFLVGNSGTYLPYSLSSLSGVTPTVTVTAFEANSGGTPGTGLCSISSTEYWELDVNSGTFSNASASLTRQAALGPLNVVGESATPNGVYTNLNGTVSGTSIINSDPIGAIVSGSSEYFVMASTTQTSPVLASASPVVGSSICAGFNTGTATITAGNGGPGSADDVQISIDGGSTWTAYTSGTAINTTGGTGSVQIRMQRTAGGSCSATGYITTTLWIFATTTSPVLASQNPASGNTICAGFNTGTATITPGSGGTGSADDIQISINGGTTWSAYTSGSAIVTTGGTGSVQIRMQRTAGTYGCSATGYSTTTLWNFATQVSPVLASQTPATGNTICAGYNSGTATITAGSGGTGSADDIQISIDGGTTWNPYTSGTAINTTGGTGSVKIKMQRTAGTYGCGATGYVVTTLWNIAVQTSPVLAGQSPVSGTAICIGDNTSTATITPGSGGTGSADDIEISIDGGTTWNPYTSGTAINTTGGSGSVVLRVQRTAGTYGCAATGYTTTTLWNFAPLPPGIPGSISGTVTQCPTVTGQTYSISAVTRATIYTWSVPIGWSITAGQGTTSITVTSGTAGQNGNITVTAGNSCGTSSAQTLAVTIPTPVVPTISAGSSTSFCRGGSVTLTTTGGTGATLWSVDQAGTVTTTSAYPLTVSHSAGITASVPSDVNGCASASSPITVIREYAPPTAHITGNNSYCTGGTSVLSANATPGSGTIATYYWEQSLDGGATWGAAPGTNNAATYTASGPSADYRVTVTNSHGCTSVFCP